MSIPQHDAEQLRQMLAIPPDEELPAEVRDAYATLARRWHRVSGGCLPPATLLAMTLVVPESSGPVPPESTGPESGRPVPPEPKPGVVRKKG